MEQRTPPVHHEGTSCGFLYWTASGPALGFSSGSTGLAHQCHRIQTHGSAAAGHHQQAAALHDAALPDHADRGPAGQRSGRRADQDGREPWSTPGRLRGQPRR